MNLKLYSIFDRQSETFSNPMFLIAPGQASRAFADEINRSAADNPLYHHPDDFELWYLAEFNPSNGHFSLCTPERIALGTNLKINGSAVHSSS